MVKNDNSSWLENNSWSWLCMCSTCCKHFPFLSSLTGFVTIVTRRVILVEQKLPTIPENVSSPPIFSGVCVNDELSFFTIFIAMEHMHSHDQLVFSSHDELSFFTMFIANLLWNKRMKRSPCLVYEALSIKNSSDQSIY
jgi:hypothetical protein